MDLWSLPDYVDVTVSNIHTSTTVLIWLLELASLFQDSSQLLLRDSSDVLLVKKKKKGERNHIKQHMPRKCWQGQKRGLQTSRNPLIFTGFLEIPL